MLRTSTLAAGLLFLGLLHSLQVIAPGGAIDGELIVSCAERQVRGRVCVIACDKCGQEEPRGDGTYYSALLFLFPQPVRATYEY